MTNLSKIKRDYVLNPYDIPKKVNNINLTEEQIDRLAFGLQTNKINDIVDKDGLIFNAKLSASYDENNNVVIQYEYEDEKLHLPETLFGHKLSEEQLKKIFDGELLGPLKYEGNDFYFGYDNKLNKFTIKTNQEIGIPKEVAGYKLNDVDKYYLANGKSLDTRVFKTKQGQYFTASLSISNDKKGVVLNNYKTIESKNAKTLIDKLNKNKKITDKSLLIGAISISEKTNADVNPNRIIEDHPKVFKTKVVKDTRLVEFKTFIPRKIKGVYLSNEQKIQLKDGQKVLVKGMNINNKPTDAYIKINEKENKLDFYYTDNKNDLKRLENIESKELNTNKFVPNSLYGVLLSPKQKQKLKKGEIVRLENMKYKGQKIDGDISINNNNSILVNPLNKLKKNSKDNNFEQKL